MQAGIASLEYPATSVALNLPGAGFLGVWVSTVTVPLETRSSARLQALVFCGLCAGTPQARLESLLRAAKLHCVDQRPTRVPGFDAMSSIHLRRGWCPRGLRTLRSQRGADRRHRCHIVDSRFCNRKCSCRNNSTI